MKIDTRYGSIWDELPANYDKNERKIPQTQQEAQDFYEAAQKSMDKALMKTWDSHNESVKETAKLRQIYTRKKILETETQKRRDEQREFLMNMK